uniref:Putative secreted protein n=1 Tax=Ixodes ricinus TaxID=34613 RepID=A0A6B0USL4_IXORI
MPALKTAATHLATPSARALSCANCCCWLQAVAVSWDGKQATWERREEAWAVWKAPAFRCKRPAAPHAGLLEQELWARRGKSSWACPRPSGSRAQPRQRLQKLAWNTPAEEAGRTTPPVRCPGSLVADVRHS